MGSDEARNKGIIDGLWRGEMKCIGPKGEGRRLVNLDLGRIAQSSSRRHTGGGRAHQSASLQEGEATKCRSSKIVSLMGSEKADELAKNGVMMYGGEMAQVRVITVQQKREEVYGALQYTVSFSLSGGGMARL